MHHQKRSIEVGDAVGLWLAGDVVEELLSDPEAPLPQGHLGGTLALDRVSLVLADELEHVLRTGRSADGGDRPGARQPGRGRQDGGTAEGVSDQQRRRCVVVTEVLRGQHHVVDVRAERGVGEVAPGLPEAGEVEPEHGDVLLDECG